MKKNFHMLFSTILVVAIAIVFLTRPEKPRLVLIGFDPSIGEEVGVKNDLASMLDILSKKEEQSQYVLFVEFGEKVKMHFEDGIKELDDSTSRFVEKADVFCPCGISSAKKASELRIMEKPVWVLSCREFEKRQYGEIVSNADFKYWFDSECIALQMVEKEVTEKLKLSEPQFLLYSQVIKLTPPEGWKSFSGIEAPDIDEAVMVLVAGEPFPQDLMIPEAWTIIGVDRKDSVDESGIDFVFQKDTITSRAKMIRIILNNEGNIPPKAAEMVTEFLETRVE